MKGLPKNICDILSTEEAKELCTRLKVAEMLQKGITYRQIIEKTGVGAATVARISKKLQNGPKKTTKAAVNAPSNTPTNRYSFGLNS